MNQKVDFLTKVCLPLASAPPKQHLQLILDSSVDQSSTRQGLMTVSATNIKRKREQPVEKLKGFL